MRKCLSKHICRDVSESKDKLLTVKLFGQKYRSLDCVTWHCYLLSDFQCNISPSRCSIHRNSSSIIIGFALTVTSLPTNQQVGRSVCSWNIENDSYQILSITWSVANWRWLELSPMCNNALFSAVSCVLWLTIICYCWRRSRWCSHTDLFIPLRSEFKEQLTNRPTYTTASGGPGVGLKPAEPTRGGREFHGPRHQPGQRFK